MVHGQQGRSGPAGVMAYPVERLISALKERVGALGWSALLVFLALRIGDVANLANKLILGKALPVEDFGAIDPVLSVVAVLSLPVGIIFQIGMKSISRLHASGLEDQRRALVQDLSKVALVGAVVSVVAVYGLRPLILDRLHLEGAWYIHMVAALFVLTWFGPLVSAVLQGEHRYGVLILPSIAGGLGGLVFTWILVIVLAQGLAGALLSRILALALASMSAFLVLRRSFVGARRSYSDEWGVMARMVVPMAAYAAGIAAMVHFDRLLVRNFLLEQSGGYGAVVTVGSIPQYFLGALTFVLFPVAAREHARGRDLNKYRRSAAIAGMGVTVLCAGVAAIAGPTLFRAWNPAFEPFSGALWVYAMAMGMHGVMEMLVSIEMARNRYGFLWLLVLPSAAYCGLLYAMRTSLSVMAIVWAGVAVRAVVLACLWQYGMGRRGPDAAEDDSSVAAEDGGAW